MGLYRVLEVDTTADAKDLREAFKRLALVRHPDKGGTAKAFRSLLHAFRILSPPFMRKVYDEKYHPSHRRRSASVKRRSMAPSCKKGSGLKTENALMSLDYGAPPIKRDR